MTIHPCFVGIDVSKAVLDLFETAQGRSTQIANASEPIAVLATQWRQAGAFVVFEATGHYDEALRRGLDAAGVAYARVNPGRARHFARYAGFLAKTDRLDARMLAEMARRGALGAEPPFDEEREALRLLHRRRDQLVAMRQKERTRLTEAAHAIEKESLERHLAFLSADIAAIERQIAEAIKASPALKDRETRLRQVPGIGPVSAAALLALMPELGQRSPKAIAALAGLAPFNCDSGQHRGQRQIAGGRKRVRDALYMAAVAASRSKSPFAAFYQKLKSAGKPTKLAFIALARKILVTLNAILRDGTSYAK